MKHDENGHRINDAGKIVFDPECDFCVNENTGSVDVAATNVNKYTKPRYACSSCSYLTDYVNDLTEHVKFKHEEQSTDIIDAFIRDITRVHPMSKGEARDRLAALLVEARLDELDYLETNYWTGDDPDSYIDLQLKPYIEQRTKEIKGQSERII